MHLKTEENAKKKNRNANDAEEVQKCKKVFQCEFIMKKEKTGITFQAPNESEKQRVHLLTLIKDNQNQICQLSAK